MLLFMHLLVFLIPHFIVYCAHGPFICVYSKLFIYIFFSVDFCLSSFFDLNLLLSQLCEQKSIPYYPNS